MARLPYSPVPGVEPGGIPNDYQRIDANPNQFGALEGQAEQRGGAQIEQGGNQLAQAGLARQQLTNELYANDANTGAMKEVTAAYGDLSKLEGRAAYDALPEF